MGIGGRNSRGSESEYFGPVMMADTAAATYSFGLMIELALMTTKEVRDSV